MASSLGGVSADACSGRVSYHRTGSSTRSTAVPVEHLRTIESGIQSDWENFPQIQPSRVVRNDSVKGHYDGSVVNVPLTRKVKVWIGLHDSRKADVWRAAAVEFVATAGLTFLSIGAYQQGKSISVAAHVFIQALIYSLVILAATPISGAHLNPSITFTTFLTGQATLVRTILYVVAQLLGGILGALGMWALTTHEMRREYSLGGCLLQKLPVEGTDLGLSTLSNKQGLVAETVFTIIMLFVVYGIGFDSRNVVVTFLISSPFIIGGIFGILIFISQGVGYTTAMNPARCFGPAILHHNKLWGPLYIFIFGPLIAAGIVAIFQHIMHQKHAAEVEPVLPLNFFHIVTPDHQRPGFGPRCPTMFYPSIDQEVDHSQQLVSGNIPTMMSSELLQQPSNQLNSAANKINLVLQVKAFMQPRTGETRQASKTNIMDGARIDQNLLLQQYSNSLGSSDGIAIHHSGDFEKDR
ncbi:uncharacterized protein [Physcomitrium patens]|uniref:Uncharacterized protein n=1 Tax=Physcomitrium patens TaxID=3218 RepID=A0A2K1JZY4_PHYPA|nr:aquaporin PIP1-6-like [Physcomitrium patens]XP_024385942.1 aquaporin PIP1-6-like [Physcomitrium patens]PNR47087.1 hypothetical protein PHYPA_014207 [Physcomitrium patens]|eukprot:XP_024385941.1 aquaporin PIP1-6-like [Physcomitrella patens]